MALSIRINYKSISDKVTKAAKVKALPVANKKAYNLFYRARGAMMREFNQHKITQEIEWGPRALNISGALDGYGNLFSFIGFDKTDKPIEELRALLEQGTKFKYTGTRGNLFYFRVVFPTKEAINQATPMPWEAGNSWVEGIEKGISNLSYYMYKRKNQKFRTSRSGTGLQADEEVNDDLTFKKTPYLSEILGNFRDRVNNSSINVL